MFILMIQTVNTVELIELIIYGKNEIDEILAITLSKHICFKTNERQV